MSDLHRPDTPAEGEVAPPGASVDAGHELRDVRVWPIVGAGVGLFTLAVVVHLAMLLVLNVFAARESKESPPANPLAGAYGPKAPPQPRLQTEPRGDLEQLHAAEDAALETYGWVDKPAGVVRIPIERAMDLVASAAGAPSGSAPAAGRKDGRRTGAAQ